MGGEAAGEVASRIFAETAEAIFVEAGTGDRSEKENYTLVQAAFEKANKNILEHVRKNPHHKGMGCTAELLALSHESYIIGHIGDSRTYRLRKEQLKQLTHDHSVAQEQVDRGLISPAEAREHPLRHIILKAIGINKRLEPDLIKGRIFPGDLFLLCSDGLTDLVDVSLIHRILSSTDALPQKLEKLIASAKSAGGYDNITVVLFEMI